MGHHRGPLPPVRVMIQLGGIEPEPAQGTAWVGWWVIPLAAEGSLRGCDLYYRRDQLEALLARTPKGEDPNEPGTTDGGSG